MTQHVLGADLRALRKSRGLTLSELSERMGKSTGWLSQVERDITPPNPDDLTALADILDVPTSLVADRAEHHRITRVATRRPIGERVPGLTEALLSPDLTDDFEVVHSTFAPGSARTDTTQRPTQELAHIVSGKLDVWIDDHAYTLHPGDSARIRGERFRWANPYSEPAIAIWVIAPPVY